VTWHRRIYGVVGDTPPANKPGCGAGGVDLTHGSSPRLTHGRYIRQLTDSLIFADLEFYFFTTACFGCLPEPSKQAEYTGIIIDSSKSTIYITTSESKTETTASESKTKTTTSCHCRRILSSCTRGPRRSRIPARCLVVILSDPERHVNRSVRNVK
jgi:hypothetical protein